MSRNIPDRPHSTATLLAATAWRDRCLAGDLSVFSDESLWTPALLEELNERFNNQPDNSKDRFQAKLKRQFAEASPSASKLAAEMLWVMGLFPSNIGPDAKRAAVSEAWSWSGEALSPDHPMLDRELLRGFGSAGPGFLAHRPRELRFLINATRAFKTKDAEQRNAILADSWGFATWLDAVPDEGYRQLKHILPFLLFPDDFERIAGPGDIRRILSGLGGVGRDQLRQMSKVDQDKALLNLRRRLEEGSTEPIDFYQPTLRQIWAPTEAETPEQDAAHPTAIRAELFDGSPALPLNLILYGPPGTGKTYKTVDRALQILDPPFASENGGDREALKARFDELVVSGAIRFVTFHQSFSYEDFVEGLRAEARSDGSIHYYVADGVLKAFCRSFETGPRLAVGTRFKSGYIVTRSTDEILWLEKPNGSNLPVVWAIIDELSRLLAEGRITFDDVRQSKVFDKVPESRLEKYLVNGYNNILPAILEAVGMDCARPAAAQRGVLIIDEINRGNVSKILGELITLLEPSKRAGASEALTTVLPYSKQPFSVPAGLHIIGTMNTADRSLTSIDMALRRRFVFEEVEPDVNSLEGIEIGGVDVARLLETLNGRIERLLDRDHRIGHAYFMNLTASDEIAPLRHLFATQIIPLLQEYFFDDWQRVRLVLNDHRKDDPDDQFIIEQVDGVEQLFGSGDLEVPTQRAWRVNAAALDRPSAYRAIIA